MKIQKFFLWVVLGTLSCAALAQDVVKKNVSIADLYKTYTYYPSRVRGINSMKDGLHYSIIEGDTAVVKYSYKTGKRVNVIFQLSELNTNEIDALENYQFNSDETKLIFYTNRTDIYRRSFTANYYVWDLKLKKFYTVSKNGVQRLATLSPDGKQVAFVRDNDIYISTLSTGEEIAVTNDGMFNEIINGAPDWVYEEEFEYNQAFAWSKSGSYLAYCKFDERKVPLFNMTVFKGLAPSVDNNELYPDNSAFKYPKAGEVNSLVSVHSYNVKTQHTQLINSGDEQDQYIPRLLWSPKDDIVFYRENRLQNKLEFLYGNPETGESTVFYTEENERYIDEKYFDYLTFVDAGEKFIYGSERSGFLHLYLHRANGEIINQVTSGDWDVTDYLGYDANKGLVYFESAERSPLQRDVMVVKTDGSSKKRLTTQAGTNTATFSTSFKYYINSYSSTVIPPVYTLHNANGKAIRVLEDNVALKEQLSQTNISNKVFFEYTTSEGVQLNGWMVKPIAFDSTKQYPVLMTQYSGPNSQSVEDRFSIGWEQVLAANGYVVACVDGRGTGARGEEFRKVTYLQLGKYETIDQIETAKYLGGLDFIDASRVGIWGWSYGGFMTLNCMTQGAKYFKAGIAVAPVTNWRYYDNIYTERFMRTPQENADGYDSNSPITHASKLEGKLLLVHGTADDNVHLQNSLEMSEALVQANKQFDMFYYTNRNHSIYGGNTRFHLFHKKLQFLKDNL